MPSVPEEHFGVYKFKCGEDTYTYKTENDKKYTNEEFINIYRYSSANWMYYKEPCTMWNDPDGMLVHFPRNEHNDHEFFHNVMLILEKSQNEEKKQLINKILNECFIVDKEPTFVEGYDLKNIPILDFLKVKEMGDYHIDQFKLKDIYRDTINFVAHKYIKKFNYDGHYNKTEEKNMDLLLSDD